MNVFLIFQLWRPDILEPVEVQRHTEPHFKDLVNANVDLEAQGRDTAFIMSHALLKKAISPLSGNSNNSRLFAPQKPT